jgi:DNA uptake protein ComE-like DNA-binding protein
VYGINDSLITTIANNLSVDTSRINKLALNSADYNELKRHPYFTSYEVKAILSYRRLIGPFTAYNELVENYILSEKTFQKVKSYLSLN